MQQPTTTSTRKKFLLWGAVLVSSISGFQFFKGSKKTNPSAEGNSAGSVKMLTQDGRLVEIDKKLLAASGKKITDKELQQWIKK